MEPLSLELFKIKSNEHLPEVLKAGVTVPSCFERHYTTSPGPLQAPGVAEATRRPTCELTLLMTDHAYQRSGLVR